MQIFQFEFVETRAKLKGCVILRREIDGDWLKKTLCVEHQNTRDRNLNTRDRNIFQNERVEIANPCVLDSTHSDLSVFVSRLCPAKEPPKKK